VNGRRLAEILKDFRNRLGKTQQQLATAAGVSGAYLAQIETGDRSPAFETLIKLCRGLDLQESDQERLIEVYEEEQRERRQGRAKNREMALRNIIDRRKAESGQGGEIGSKQVGGGIGEEGDLSNSHAAFQKPPSSHYSDTQFGNPLQDPIQPRSVTRRFGTCRTRHGS
jgi:transcriptional regulator with XRE-family HTH domain